MKKLFLIVLMAFSMFANAQTHWTYNSHTQYNMTITGEMFLNGESMRTADNAQYLEIGVFVGDECRGAYLPTLNPSSYYEGYAYQMQVYANTNGEEMNFKVYDHQTAEVLDIVCTSGFTFQSDANLGTLRNPYAIEFFTTCEITVTANPTAGGTVDGGGVYNHGSEATLSAVANTGYTFVNWTKGTETVSENAEFTITVTEAGDYVANFSLNSYDITTSVTPNNAGTVTGAGTYDHFANCTLTATAATGYTFNNWTKNGQVVSSDAIYTFEVTGGGEYVANFTLNSYEITASVAPANTGTVSGAGTYNHFASCTLTATAATGYHFVNWTKDGVQVSTNATYTFEVTGAGAYVANFAINTYAITASVAPANTGTVSGAGTYNHGASCTLTATPATGYHFVNWTKNGQAVSTNANYTFTVTEAGAYVANFAINTYAITTSVAPANTGTVTGAGTYNHGASCTLTATANTGYHFVNWTKNGQAVSTNATYTFTVTEAGAYVANFAINTYAITASVAPANSGTVSGASTYNHGASCTLTATPATGYHFVNWTKNGQAVSTSANYTFTVTEAGSYVANFAINTYAITATANPAAGGSAIGAGTYNHGASCTLTATANTGYHFVNWTKNGQAVSTNANYTFTVTEACAYVANFELNTYAITATANPTAGGSIQGAGTYTHGQTCTLTATAAASSGYHFVNWTKNGVQVSTNASYTFTVTEAGSYVANFALNNYNITVSATPAAGGTAQGAGTYTYGQTATLTATAATGYTFTNWKKNGQVVSTSASYSFTVTEGGAYVANFALNTYTIAATADPAVGGTIQGAGTYAHGESATLTATAATGYTFTNWTKNGQVVSTNASYTFTVTSAASYVAHFTLNTYAITATANPAVGGSIQGAGTYNHGATVTLTATAATGYTFVNWTKGGTVVSTNATYSFTATEAGAYVANFSLNSYAITASVTPANSGTVSGASTYNHGASCTLTATAATGYHFVNWTKNGVQVSTSASYTFTVTGAGAYEAHFAINTYAITASVSPDNTGTVQGAGTYNHGASCTLTATPATGYHFVNWTKNGQAVSTSASYTFTVTEAGAYVANFAINTYNITASVAVANTGTVTGAGTYNHGASCTLTATAATGYHFVNWTKNGQAVSTSANYTFTVTEAGAYVANFAINTYAITASVLPSNSGTVTGAGTYNHGASCTLTATPATGYYFVNWTKGGTVVSTNANYTFTVTEAGAYVANFSLNPYEIVVSANPTYGGTATGAGTYTYGQSATLTATPATGYQFINWTKNGQVVSTSANYTFTVTNAGAYVANFNPIDYTVITVASPSVGGTVTGGGHYLFGQTCTVYAEPAEGYSFVNWTNNAGEIVSTNVIYQFNVYAHEMMTAHFSLNTFNISATASPSYGGTVEGAGNYNYGASCTLTATPAIGYVFVNWTKDGDEVSTDAAYTFTVYEAGSYVANFEILSYTITAVANPAEGGTVSGAGTYNYGENCTLSATAAAGYEFINWTKGSEVVSTENTFTFAVTASGDYIANFEEIIIPTYTVTVIADPADLGTVTGGGVYEEGTEVTITAIPLNESMFVNWTENDIVVSEELTFTFTVTSDRTFVAHFNVDNVIEIADTRFSIYPNPVVNELIINGETAITRCEIFTINGEMVYSQDYNTNSVNVNVENLAEGSYIVRIVSEGMVQTKRFIKQ